MTKSGKMKEKNPRRRIISFNFNRLTDQPVGIKLALKIKGVRSFIYFETLLI